MLYCKLMIIQRKSNKQSKAILEKLDVFRCKYSMYNQFYQIKWKLFNKELVEIFS